MADKKRRQLMSSMVAGVVAVPVNALMGTLPSYAQEMVDPTAAPAQALSYSEASEKADQACANCTLYTGENGAATGGCPLFPGQLVTAGGWCNAWVLKS